MGVKSFRQAAGAGLALIGFLAVAGCSSRGTVSGKVTFKNKPLKGGTVLFYSEGKGTFRGPIQDDGTYTATDVPAGPVKIGVIPASGTTGSGARYSRKPPKDVQLPEEAKDNPLYGGPTTPAAKGSVKIPDKYQDPQKSRLTYEVTAGNQTKDLPLE